jgi:hypothetical protein
MLQIEVQLNSRFDAVIALAKTAAQYAKHESETIIEAVQTRGATSPVPLLLARLLPSTSRATCSDN